MPLQDFDFEFFSKQISIAKLEVARYDGMLLGIPNPISKTSIKPIINKLKKERIILVIKKWKGQKADTMVFTKLIEIIG